MWTYLLCVNVNTTVCQMLSKWGKNVYVMNVVYMHTKPIAMYHTPYTTMLSKPNFVPLSLFSEKIACLAHFVFSWPALPASIVGLLSNMLHRQADQLWWKWCPESKIRLIKIVYYERSGIGLVMIFEIFVT